MIPVLAFLGSVICCRPGFGISLSTPFSNVSVIPFSYAVVLLLTYCIITIQLWSTSESPSRIFESSSDYGELSIDSELSSEEPSDDDQLEEQQLVDGK